MGQNEPDTRLRRRDFASRRGFMGSCCTRTVPKNNQLASLGLALSEKQIPQIVENNESRSEGIEPLEATGVRPRQVRYQAALRPDTDGEKAYDDYS